MKFSKNTVASLTLPAGKVDHIEWDDELPGFGIRLRGTARRWVVQYRVNGQQRRESLGDIRKATLEDARRIARQRFAQVELGSDPAADRAQARAQAAAAGLTLAVCADNYLAAKKDRLRPSTYDQAQRYFANHWKPLRGIPIAAITRAMVAARLQELVKERGRASAKGARSALKAFYSWAMKEGICETNPAIATNDPNAGALPRDRILSDAEIVVIWRACGGDDAGRIIKLLLLTGCRREEIGALRRSEIPETGIMTIPGNRTKNGRTHELLLPAVAIEILQSAPQREPYVFGRGGGRPFSGWSATKLKLDAKIVMATGKPLAPWRIHDLRRTMRSGLGRLGIAPHVAELCLNHTKIGMAAIYDRHTYQPEIKTALAVWAAHIVSLVEERAPTVVSMKRA
jgi:integrase